MSIYVFKTAQLYGGATKVFTDKNRADTYLKEYVSKAGATDAVIEEHVPHPDAGPANTVHINVVRGDGFQLEKNTGINWVSAKKIGPYQ